MSEIKTLNGYAFADTEARERVSHISDEMGTPPEYWLSELQEGAREINTALTNAGFNKSAFLFYTDAHWNHGSQMSPRLLKYLYENTGMAKTFYGGDIVNNEADNYDTMSYLWEWRKMLKGVPNHHSVAGNHDDGNNNGDIFDEKYVYGYLLAAEETSDIVRGKNGLYYYIDNPSEKTRYLFLDTACKGLNSDQKEFVDEALLTTPDGWHIVAIAHIWHDTDYTVDPPAPDEMSASGSYLLDRFEQYNNREGQFSDCHGWFEFCIGGHTHRDFDSVSPNGIPVLLMETDSYNVRSGLPSAEGTTNESSVNGIVADYDAKKIYVVRVGRGESREVNLTWYEVKYTNVLFTSLAADGVTIYNANDTPGYKANTRWSSSSAAEVSRDGTYITGWIPCSIGDVFRLKNMTTMSDNFKVHMSTVPGDIDEGGTHSDIITYHEGIVDEAGHMIQFTMKDDRFPYIRVECGYIGPDSIITINEEIPD